MSAEPTTKPALSFAAARALKREIHDAAVDVKRNLKGNPKCVVLTAQQYAALHMIEGGEDLFFLEGRLRMVSDEAIGKPLPDGQWQILDFVPAEANRIARDTVNGVLVSTIDLAKELDDEAIATCFPPREPRYETHVGSDPDNPRRYVTRDEALAGHAEAIEKLRAKDKLISDSVDIERAVVAREAALAPELDATPVRCNVVVKLS